MKTETSDEREDLEPFPVDHSRVIKGVDTSRGRKERACVGTELLLNQV